MSYWVCQEANIKDEGRILEIRFKDTHSIETMTIQLPIEHWKNIMIYRNAYEEPERRLMDAHRDLCRYLFDVARLIKESETENKND